MAARFASPESCKIYNLNAEELLQNKEEYTEFLTSLGNVGVDVELLERMVTNRRHQLLVLLGPADTWDERGPKVYCAIQVCLEGNIPHVPELDEKDPFNNDIKKTFVMFPQLPYESLIGVRIVHLFLLPDVLLLQEEYESNALKLLKRYLNGEVAEQIMEELPQREGNILTWLHTRQDHIHYLGTFTYPSIGDVQHWERHGFKLFFVGYVQEDTVRCVMLLALDDYETFINRKYSDCSLDDLFKAFGRMFTSLLHYWRDFDRILALRILRKNIALVQQGDPRGTPTKPWNKIAEKRIEAFIQNLCDIELVTDLIPGIAQSYFGGALPITLAENEEYVLLVEGLMGRHVFSEAKEAMNLGEAEILVCFRRIFAAVVDYFNTQSPEVVDD